MTDDESGLEMDQINVRVPAETKELAKRKLDHGGLTRVVRERLMEIAHGAEITEKARLKQHLEELREERRELKRRRADIDDRLEELEGKIARAEDRLDSIRDREGEYEGALQMLEAEMHDTGMHVFEDHAKVQEAALVGQCSPEDVLDDLRERNPNLPEEQFAPRNGMGEL